MGLAQNENAVRQELALATALGGPNPKNYQVCVVVFVFQWLVCIDAIILAGSWYTICCCRFGIIDVPCWKHLVFTNFTTWNSTTLQMCSRKIPKTIMHGRTDNGFFCPWTMTAAGKTNWIMVRCSLFQHFLDLILVFPNHILFGLVTVVW
jgi:hypothetical protein